MKDLFKPNVFGVGYFGEGKYSSKNHTKCYQCWKDMLDRCYTTRNPRSSNYVGCSVADEWHNFQVFAEWYEANFVEGYQLDKDIKVKGNKVYGPDTCTFVSPKENAIASNALYWEFICPEGNYLKIYNLKQFCKDNHLSQGCMHMVHTFKRKSHKGYKKYINKE